MMANSIPDPILSTTLWSEFELVSLHTCKAITLKLKSTFYPHDAMPS